MLPNRLTWGALVGVVLFPLLACSGSGGGHGTHDAGAFNDAGHDTSNGTCWTVSDCQGGYVCEPPGQSVCAGACLAVLDPCSSDSDCATDAAVPLICVAEPCTCGPTNLGCSFGCAADPDCPEGESCGANHHCAPIACSAAGQACPPDFTCGADGTCARKPCSSDSQCSNACVAGRCYQAPGRCQLAGL
jgi:hypothetical protein